MCRAVAECFNVKPGTIPQLFDKPEFFDKIAERSQLTGQSPDLLFFAFYYQPVSLLFPLPFLTHPITSVPSDCRHTSPIRCLTMRG